MLLFLKKEKKKKKQKLEKMFKLLSIMNLIDVTITIYKISFLSAFMFCNKKFETSICKAISNKIYSNQCITQLASFKFGGAICVNELYSCHVKIGVFKQIT